MLLRIYTRRHLPKFNKPSGLLHILLIRPASRLAEHDDVEQLSAAPLSSSACEPLVGRLSGFQFLA